MRWFKPKDIIVLCEYMREYTRWESRGDSWHNGSGRINIHFHLENLTFRVGTGADVMLYVLCSYCLHIK
ncbi:hypothetical protein Hanom_Chr17g01564651 [Helianthus anomalus]